MDQTLCLGGLLACHSGPLVSVTCQNLSCLVITVALNIASVRLPWGFSRLLTCRPSPLPRVAVQAAAEVDLLHSKMRLIRTEEAAGLKPGQKEFRHSCSNMFIESWKSQDYTVC